MGTEPLTFSTFRIDDFVPADASLAEKEIRRAVIEQAE
jgi:hypothetical protein